MHQLEAELAASAVPVPRVCEFATSMYLSAVAESKETGASTVYAACPDCLRIATAAAVAP